MAGLRSAHRSPVRWADPTIETRGESPSCHVRLSFLPSLSGTTMELRSGTVVPAALPPQIQPRPNLSLDALSMFHQGVGILLSRWTALQLAVHNEWGGPSSHTKAQQLHEDIVAWMTQPKSVRYIDELEDMLDENLIALFNAETEDGSLEEVAEKVMILYEDCLDGKYESVRDLISSNNVASHSASRSQQVEYEEEDGDPVSLSTDRDPMEIDDSKRNSASEDPVVDEKPILEDGWQLVYSKMRRTVKRRT